MRHLILLALTAVLGCAATTTMGGGGGVPETTRIEGASGVTSITRTTADDAVWLRYAPISLDSAWRALPAAYATLGIPVTTSDRATYTFGGVDVKVRRALAKMPLSRYVDCGRAPEGPKADMYEMLLTVVTQLRNDNAKGVAVATLVRASARSPSFTANEVTCASTGVLEQRIVALLTEGSK
jgi:hypothetical protein